MNAKLRLGIIVAFIAALLSISVYAVVSMPSKQEVLLGASAKEPVMLDGAWASKVSENKVMFTALVKGNSIEVNLISEDTSEGDLTALYWAGTFRTMDEKTWTSVADTERLSGSILGSMDTTKTFTYEDGKLSFNFGALGVTKIIQMEKL